MKKNLLKAEKHRFRPKSEEAFYREISDILGKARRKTYQTINTVMTKTYWLIGKKIVEQEQQGKGRANYGEYLISNLSRFLGEQFGRGFSVANLKNFRQFYMVFHDKKGYTLCSRLSWSHIRLIMRVDDKKERFFTWMKLRNKTGASGNWKEI